MNRFSWGSAAAERIALGQDRGRERRARGIPKFPSLEEEPGDPRVRRHLGHLAPERRDRAAHRRAEPLQ